MGWGLRIREGDNSRNLDYNILEFVCKINYLGEEGKEIK